MKQGGREHPTGALLEATVMLQPVASGILPRRGVYSPQRIELKAEKPSGLARAPELVAPRFGVLLLGPRESPTRVIVIVDQPEGKPAGLYLDANANGDLTDDPAPERPASTTNRQSSKGSTMYRGAATIELMIGGKPVTAYVGLYRLKDDLLCYIDFGYEGEITLADAAYKAVLLDRPATGDFQGTLGPRGSGEVLMIDVNKNGQFDKQGESYDVRRPFNIKGTTYEIAGLSASGAEFRIRKSD